MAEPQAQATAAKLTSRNTEAVEVLRKLNDLGAINLDVLISKAAEIKAITGGCLLYTSPSPRDS